MRSSPLRRGAGRPTPPTVIKIGADEQPTSPVYVAELRSHGRLWRLAARVSPYSPYPPGYFAAAASRLRRRHRRGAALWVTGLESRGCHTPSRSQAQQLHENNTLPPHNRVETTRAARGRTGRTGEADANWQHNPDTARACNTDRATQQRLTGRAPPTPSREGFAVARRRNSRSASKGPRAAQQPGFASRRAAGLGPAGPGVGQQPALGQQGTVAPRRRGGFASKAASVAASASGARSGRRSPDGRFRGNRRRP